jgi:hypothetical protein
MNLQQWLDNYILDPFNPNICFNLGLCYDELGQTASAAGYYLRSVEFGTDDNKIYEALLKIALCFERQGNRVFTLKGTLLQAISLLPKRPEAYFLLARVYERNKDWQESYTTATIGEQLATDEPQTLTDVEYPGKWGFQFEKAVTGWWIGLYDESAYLFRDLNQNYNLPLIYKNAVINNLKLVGANWKEPSIYKKYQFEDLKFKFNNSFDIEQNYSQCYQDMFVLTILNGLKGGKYLEVGCADPFYGNNTALLENNFGWTGISIDIDQTMVDKFKQERNNTVIQSDATKVNYSELLKDELVWDYLQVDCDPPTVSYDVLTKIPFHTHKFKVITFEHDHYADDTQTIRDKSRKYLESFGYELVVDNISPDDYSPYEDWWVHPSLVDANIVKLMKQVNNKVKNSKKYIYNK